MINHHLKSRRFVSVLLAALFIVTLLVPMSLPVSAANRRFISELRVEAGAEAVDRLEADGWSVMMVGLNVTPDPTAQVYLAYKMNTGDPVTNVILSDDMGDSFTDENGIVYTCVSHVDVDEGIEGSAGYLYATRDERAGAPLVGLDVMRGSTEDDKVLYTISNDGADIVLNREGKPADLENADTKGVVYLFQIRDGIVRPYIKEIGVVTDTDKWNAVYTAAERGFNYYVEGDIDDSSDTYTIIAYERTADPKEAVTGIVAVSAETVKSLEDAQIVDGDTENKERITAAAISISGAEYVRVSSQPIDAKEPFYLYRTKDENAGNPVSMIYAETPEQTQNFMFGMWANSYFFSPGTTTAYSFCMNEDLYTVLWEDKTVCCKLPVRLFDSVTLAPDTTEEPVTETTETEAPVEAAGYINLTMLTPRDGLPASAGRITGMRSDPVTPFIERTERSERNNKYQASVFGKGGVIALVIGFVIILVAITVVIVKKITGDKKPKKTGGQS